MSCDTFYIGALTILFIIHENMKQMAKMIVHSTGMFGYQGRGFKSIRQNNFII